MEMKYEKVEKAMQALQRESKRTATPSTYRERYQRLGAERVQSLGLLTKDLPDWAQGLSAAPKPGSSESKAVQPYWNEVVLPLLPDDNVVLVDKHNAPSFGYRKPDIVGYLAGRPKSVAYVALLGELKPRRAKGKAEFDEEEKGHLESFLEDLLLTYQPWRTMVYGFLSDGYLIQFFRLSLRSGREATLRVLEGPELSLCDDGAIWLDALLREPSYTGLDLESRDETVEAEDYLGCGGSAVVFSGKWNGMEVVIKRFRPGRQAALRQEKKNLKKVQVLGNQVPRTVAKLDGALILQPIGDKFASSITCQGALANADDFAQLVDILEQAHKKCGLVHRDVRLNNFFRIKGTTRVFLNDWGSAVVAGKPTHFEGALQHAPNEILDSWETKQKYTPKFSHDLEMVVRSVFHGTNMMAFRQIQAEEDPQALRRFWTCHLAPTLWQRMLTAAQACQYGALKLLIAELLPSLV